MSSNNFKCVRVSYIIDDVFKIPKHINLEDETQVERWFVKWNTLYITLTNGKELEVDSEGWVEGFDYKYPDGDTEIVDADEVGLDEKDFETEDEKPEPKPEPEPEQDVVKIITFEGKKYLKSKNTISKN